MVFSCEFYGNYILMYGILVIFMRGGQCGHMIWRCVNFHENYIKINLNN